MKHCYLFATVLACSLSCFAQDEWRPVGTATIIDGWITPGYVDDNGKQIDPKDCPFDVNIEESLSNPGIYRLVNAWSSPDFHLYDFNIEPSDANYVIDARDRTCVLFQPQYVGYTDEDPSEPSGKYSYYLSDMGTYQYNMGQQREVLGLFKTCSTMNGRTISIPYPCFGTSVKNASYTWDPSFPAQITIPDVFADEEDQWELMGKATLIDGWFMPGYVDDYGKGFNAEDYPVTCDIMMNNDNPDLLCLVAPYSQSSFPFAGNNLTSRKARIIIDITDPEFVKVEPQFSGYIVRSDNDIIQYFISDGGTLLASRGASKEEVVAAGNNATFDYKENKIVIPSPLMGFNINDVIKMWKNPQRTVISWNTGGVNDIDSDNSNLPVEYYNLQGVKVSNPAPGQLYIRRQGNTASKVVF